MQAHPSRSRRRRWTHATLTASVAAALAVGSGGGLAQAADGPGIDHDRATSVTQTIPGAHAGVGDMAGSLVDAQGHRVGSGTGGDVSVNPPADTAQATKKNQLAAAYVDAKYGKRGDQRYEELAADYRRRFGPPDVVASSVEPAVQPPGGSGGGTTKHLYVKWAQQQKSWYCGPASGYMLLDYTGDHHSRAGTRLSQSALAGSSYMRTDSNRGTPWASGNYWGGLNRWREGRTTGYFISTSRPTAATFRADAVWSIDHGVPLSADTVELKRRAHYNRHPGDRTIGHWILFYWYSSSGARIRLADPAAGLPGGYELTRRNTVIDAAPFAQTFLHDYGNGIVF